MASELMAREAWTDELLDDLNTKVDRLDVRMEAGFREVRGEIAVLNRSIHQLTVTIFAAMLVGFLGVIATILTQT